MIAYKSFYTIFSIVEDFNFKNLQKSRKFLMKNRLEVMMNLVKIPHNFVAKKESIICKVYVEI